MTQVITPTVHEMSSWGPDDPHIPKPHHLAKAIIEHLDLDDATKDEVDFFADRLVDKLESALMYYQFITASDFEQRNTSQKRTIYEGLYANLWSFYKGRVQNYLQKMNWNLAIFFCRECRFSQESDEFLRFNPDHADLVSFAQKQRAAWQTDFGHSRDVAEHSGDYRDGTNSHENPVDAKRLFAQVCWSAETLIAYCGSYKMRPDWNVTEIKPSATIFDREPRYIVEHAVMTTQRERSKDTQ